MVIKWRGSGQRCVCSHAIQCRSQLLHQRPSGHGRRQSLAGQQRSNGQFSSGATRESGAVVAAINNTIDGNDRGAYVDGSATQLQLTNNLITNNGTGGVFSINRGVASLAFNDVYNPTAGQGNFNGLAAVTGQDGNVSVDPNYVNRGAGDLRLQGSSPVIDAATSEAAPLADLDFNSRIDLPGVPNSGGGASPFYDMGAYEFGGRPRAVEHEPVGANVGPINSALFTFRGAMDTTSFSLASDVVSFGGPVGSIAPYAFRWLNPYQLQVDFPPQGLAARYSLTVGPNIVDAGGKPMDQDGDGAFGVIPDDRYAATWTITPPRIVRQSPTDYVSGTIDHLTFTFDRAMDITTFAPADDILKFAGPSGNLTATGHNWMDAKTLTVSFAPQTALGFYEMALSPQIADASGNVLDQNGNQVAGESPADQYKAPVTLADILFVSGAITQNTTWIGLVVIEGDVTVNSGVTLTIAPGTVVKFVDATTLTVAASATLSAGGTAAQPIYFTSLHDDSVGGDTDRNGNLVGPSAGDWGQINNKGTAHFDHARVLYGSGIGNTGLNSGAVRNEGGTLTFANSMISQAFYDGLDTVGGNIVMSNSLVIGADRGVVATLGGATISIINSTIDDNRIGVFAHAGGAVTVKNSIVSNSLQIGILTDSGLVPTTYSDVWSNVAGSTDYSGMPDQTGTLGNVSVDPKFIAPEEGNYRLDYRSPVIDAADGPIAPATDYFGRARYDDPRSVNKGTPTSGGAFADMGAMEFVEGAPSPVDLATSAVGGPAAAMQGDQITVQWTVQNVGSDVARGTWNDGIYFSSDPVWSADDVLLGSELHTGDLGVNQSYQASAEVLVPPLVPGNYYLLVRANADDSLFEGQNLGNNTAVSEPLNLDLPELQIGTPLQGAFLARGEARAYKLVVPPGEDVVINLTGSAGTTNELYARLGSVPSQQDFYQRSTASGQASPSLVIPSSQTGTNYILVRATAVAGLDSYALTATTPGFALSSLEPAKGDNSGLATLTFHGTSFTADALPQLVDSSGQTINPTAVYFTDSTLLSATFDLRGHAIGSATAKIAVPGSGSAQLASAFEIVTGSPATLSAHITAPSRIRLGRDYAVIVEYTNTGNADLLAPIMRLQNAGTSPLSFTHDFSGDFSFLDLVGVSSHGPAGILPPGGQGRIELFAHSTGPGNGTDSFRLTVGNYPATPINWAGMDALIRPEGIDDESWSLMFERLQANIGANWSDYQRTISQDATLLSPPRG